MSEREALFLAKKCVERAADGDPDRALDRLLWAMTDCEPTSYEYVALRAAMDEIQENLSRGRYE